MLKSIPKSCLKLPNFLSDLRNLSAVVNPQVKEKSQYFRCSESNPQNHTVDNLGQFYTIPKEDQNVVFAHGGLPTTFKTQCKTFNETCIMIRKPSLDIINILKNLDYSKPAYKFVLYGPLGCGKSLSLTHILHYAYKSGYLLIHVPWVSLWMRRCKESCVSVVDESLTDLNIDAAVWLTHFKTQNAALLKKDEFKVSQDYEWNKREKTLKGAPLIELIDFGINRIKYASYCTMVLIDEVKKLSTAGVCKSLAVIDGFNGFYHPVTNIYKEKKEVVPPHKLTLTKAFLNLTNFDWTNAAIVLTVDPLASAERRSKVPPTASYFPRYLLGKEGFEHLDPFLPVSVENYSEKELLSCVEYYKDRKWIQRYYPGLEDELSFVSNSNPYKLLEVAAPL